MGPGEVFSLLIVVLIPTIFLSYMARRFFTLREKQLDTQSSLAAEKAAQYAAHVERIEARLRVLEQIVTDGGAQTSAQIEALRDPPRMEIGDKVR
jgi:hypothetical protein